MFINKEKNLWMGLMIAHFLIFLSYRWAAKEYFWVMYSISSFCLIVYALIPIWPSVSKLRFRGLLYGSLSGILLYLVFRSGYTLLHLVKLDLSSAVDNLYSSYKPKETWQIIVLILLFIPSEEIFWRSFVQKVLSKYFSFYPCILFSALLYSLPLLYSANIALVLAGIFAGLFWGFLYEKHKSLTPIIFSHLVFDLFLLVAFPLENR